MRSDRNIENDQIKKPEGHTCKKMQKEDLLLYAVTDRHWLNGETLYSQVEKTLEGLYHENDSVLRNLFSFSTFPRRSKKN